MPKLNLGCGERYREGYINLDTRENCKIDVCHDLNNYPYPFEDNFFDECLLEYVLGTGIKDAVKCIKEVVRITKPHGKIIIQSTHATSYANISGLYQSNCNMNEGTFTEYKLREFEIDNLIRLVKMEYIFIHGWKRYIPFKHYLKIFVNGLYDDIRFEFEVIKDEQPTN